MKILIVDDHHIVVTALGQLVKSRYPVAQAITANSFNEAKAFLESEPEIDLVISDLNFNGKMDGFEIIKVATAQNPRLKLLLLTMHKEAALVRKAMSLGAAGYIVKTDSPEEIFNAVQCVLNGKVFLSPSIQDMPRKMDALSAREQEIARLVIEGSSSSDIGEKLSISHRTVEVHRRNIMKKLGVHNAAEMVKVFLANTEPAEA